MVAGLIATLLAPVTGGLFGLAYGTAIRIGYEQIYPALFPKKGPLGLTPEKQDVISGLVQMYDIIGGKGAHEFGINIGIQNAMKNVGNELFNSPELNELIKIEAGIGGVGVSGSSGLGRDGLGLQFSQLGGDVSKIREEALKTSIVETEQQRKDRLELERLREAERQRSVLVTTQIAPLPSGVSKSGQFGSTFVPPTPPPAKKFQQVSGSPQKQKEIAVYKAQQKTQASLISMISQKQRGLQSGGRGVTAKMIQDNIAVTRKLQAQLVTLERLMVFQKVKIDRMI